MKINVDSGKYTFVKQNGFYIDVLRHGEEWVRDIGATNAITSLMCELDAARVVMSAVRAIITTPGITFMEMSRQLVQAVEKHDSLVSDREPPSEWSR